MDLIFLPGPKWVENWPLPLLNPKWYLREEVPLKHLLLCMESSLRLLLCSALEHRVGRVSLPALSSGGCPVCSLSSWLPCYWDPGSYHYLWTSPLRTPSLIGLTDVPLPWNPQSAPLLQIPASCCISSSASPYPRASSTRETSSFSLHFPFSYAPILL